MQSKKILITALILFLFPLSVLATGLSVSPARLDFVIDSGRQASKTITVANPTADAMIFEVYPDEFESVIKSDPASFTLEAGGRKKVTVTVDASKIKDSALSTNLSITGRPLADSKMNISAGAKIPVAISINSASGKPSNLKSGLIIIVILTSLLLFFRRRLSKI